MPEYRSGKYICFHYLDLVAQRGEKIELLIDKTESLVDSVSHFLPAYLWEHIIWPSLFSA